MYATLIQNGSIFFAFQPRGPRPCHIMPVFQSRTQRRERLTTSLTAHLPRRCILRRIYSRGGGRGSGHGFSSKDARRGGLGDHCRRLFLPSGDAAPAVAGCPRGGWSDPDRRIRKPVASVRRPLLILPAEAPRWSQPTQATSVVGTASGASQLAAFSLPPRRAFSNYATAFGLTSISEVRPP